MSAGVKTRDGQENQSEPEDVGDQQVDQLEPDRGKETQVDEADEDLESDHTDERTYLGVVVVLES